MSELVRQNIKDIYRMTPTQEGMYFHYLLDKDSLAYLEQTVYRLHGNLDMPLVKRSLEELFSRYDILRTVFNHEKVDVPLQVVLKQRDVDFFYKDLREMTDEAGRTEYLTAYKSSDKQRKFDLTKDVLMRVAVFRLGEREYEFIWTSHHILMDGWCVEILVSNFSDIYSDLVHGRPSRLTPVKQYRAYVEWLEAQNRQQTADFWKHYLRGFEEQTAIPAWSLPELTHAAYNPEQVRLELSREQTDALNRIAGKNHVTLSTVMKTAWGVLLAKYNRKQDVVFGGVVSGRPAELDGVEDMVGLFINTIPVRIMAEDQTRLSDLFKRVQADAAETEPFHYYSLAKIQADSSLKQNLFDHIFVFENFPLAERLDQAVQSGAESGGAQAEFTISDVQSFEQTHYDFNILIAPGDKLYVQFDFNGAVHSRAFVERLAKHYELVLNQLVAEDGRTVQEIELVGDEEKATLVHKFNATDAAYPDGQTIHGLFEAQCELTPDRTAVLWEGAAMTYRELNRRANQLARTLRAKGVQREAAVGLLIERSPEMFISVLAILKAGGAYLPLNAGHPQERIEYMLADAGVRWIITDIQGGGAFAGQYETIDVHDADSYAECGDNPDEACGPEQLAYIIYTSGSTGQPKGVMVEHRSVMNRLNWMQEAYRLHENDTILQKTPLTFDVSVWELFWWFFAGAKVCLLPPGAEKNPDAIVDIVEQKRVTVMHFVPSMLVAFLHYVEESAEVDRLGSLKRVMVSGEALTEAHVHKFNETLHAAGGTELTNLYGPTEATVDVTYYDCPPGEAIRRVPIGKPIDNTRIYIVHHDRLQPVGVPGELYIAGANLARGYRNREALTAEKFIPGLPGLSERLYRTGDLARWMPDGSIEYLGRLDHQVKIRGFRIELEEIESALHGHEKLQGAVVSVREEGGDKKLAAYVKAAQEVSAAELRSYLSRKLPEYMVPAEFVLVEEIPLNPSGKADRKRLHALEGKRLAAETAFKEPATGPEKVIADIWKEVLQVKTVGIHDNFFDLNGTSLDVIKVTSKLKKAFNKEFEVVSMFMYPTIAQFSKHALEQPEETPQDLDREAVLQAANTRLLSNVARFKQQGRG
ncbi:amino acid adenylation domain-containing protein [Paenibacillus elgii]